MSADCKVLIYFNNNDLCPSIWHCDDYLKIVFLELFDNFDDFFDDARDIFYKKNHPKNTP